MIQFAIYIYIGFKIKYLFHFVKIFNTYNQ